MDKLDKNQQFMGTHIEASVLQLRSMNTDLVSV
jgi:hypothetical protein